jgi:hypothetical protein
MLDTEIEKAHAAFAFDAGARCACCGRAPYVRAIVMAPFDEARKRGLLFGLTDQQVMALLVRLKSGTDPKGEVFVRLTTSYACQACAPDFERAAAKHPSWAVVEINRGPTRTRPTSNG